MIKKNKIKRMNMIFNIKTKQNQIENDKIEKKNLNKSREKKTNKKKEDHN